MLQSSPKKIVLAYSGGLDTSVILPWLKERYPGVKVVAFAAESGRARSSRASRKGQEERRRRSARHGPAPGVRGGILLADAARARDVRAGYLLGTSIARPLIAKHQVLSRRRGRRRRRPRRHRQGQRPGALRAHLHGAGPDLKIIAPWKDPKFLADGLRARETAVEYAASTASPSAPKKKIYSQDRNLWHITHEGARSNTPTRSRNGRV